MIFVTLVVGLGLGVGGCRSSTAEDPLLRERVISIESEALGRFLAQTQRLSGTPIAEHSRRLLDRAADCPEFWAHIPAPDGPGRTGSGLDLTALDCRADLIASPELAALVAERRGEADGFVSWPVGEDGRVELRLEIDRAGGLEIEGIFVPPTRESALSMLVAGSAPPAAPAIEPTSTLVHLRMRPANGIGLSKLIPAGSQADRLFALKGRLLEGALLTGTWEIAFVPPAEGGAMPLAVGALHHRMAGALEEALSEALSQLEATWPIERAPRSFTLRDGSQIDGGCFLELPLLPELAPCWVVTPEAMLIGYRGEALEAALAPPAVSSPAAPNTNGLEESAAAGSLDVHLDRLERVDAVLLDTEAGIHPGALFSKFSLRMVGEPNGQISLHARLRPRS